MRIDGIPYRSIWLADDGETVEIIDQTRLPHEFAVKRLESVADAARAIRDMEVRGAPLIGATAAYGLCLAARQDPSDSALAAAAEMLMATRPTAINLRWAIAGMRARLAPLAPDGRARAAYAAAAEICDDDVAINRAIGAHGLDLIREVHAGRASAGQDNAGQGNAGQDNAVDILTHCNAGWLATVDWGTALAPIYAAHDAGIPVHVWVSETRPRNQGAGLTAWELGRHGVPHTVIVDNAGGHLMREGRVDLCITGTDRTTAAGDVCNKIGTYLKALAARDNGVPFYVALPSPSIDWTIADGRRIPIEERGGAEITRIAGRGDDGGIATVAIVPPETAVANFGFDVTPARLITGLITERGVGPASAKGLRALFPERAGEIATAGA